MECKCIYRLFRCVYHASFSVQGSALCISPPVSNMTHEEAARSHHAMICAMLKYIFFSCVHRVSLTAQDSALSTSPSISNAMSSPFRLLRRQLAHSSGLALRPLDRAAAHRLALRLSAGLSSLSFTCGPVQCSTSPSWTRLAISLLDVPRGSPSRSL